MTPLLRFGNSIELVQPAPLELSTFLDSKAIDYIFMDLSVTGVFPRTFTIGGIMATRKM